NLPDARTKAFMSCLSFDNRVADRLKAGPDSGWLNNVQVDVDTSELGTGNVKGSVISGINLAPFWAWQEQCRQANLAWGDAIAQAWPHQVENFRGPQEQYTASVYAAYEALAAIVSSEITAITDLQRATINIANAMSQL